MTNQTQPRQAFFLGDNWCYYKLYCGPKTGDRLLAQALAPLTQDLQQRGLITGWFFIRYADPSGHLRLRLLTKETDHLAQIITAMHRALTPWLEQGLVWKVQTDTYQRELERYGRDTMELSETFFHHDSRMTADLVALLDGDDGERVRWLMALRASDRLLDDFGLSLDEKSVMINDFRDGYGREFGMNKALKQHLETKYRKDKPVIEQVLLAEGTAEDEYQPLYRVIQSRSEALAVAAKEIRRLAERPDSDVNLKSLLHSYLHMMNNRLFRSRQRLHELVLYDFLALFYRSQLARRSKKMAGSALPSQDLENKDRRHQD